MMIMMITLKEVGSLDYNKTCVKKNKILLLRNRTLWCHENPVKNCF